MRHITNILGHPAYSFNHCSSIVKSPNPSQEPIIIGYCGKECTDEQRVFIHYDGIYLTFEPKTGNPIIWEHDNKINILYSRFEDVDGNGIKPNSPVERWKFCSNHHIQLSARELIKKIKNNPESIEKGSVEIKDMFGLLARCQPVDYQGDCLIPMYREQDPICQIWSLSSDNHLIFKSSFGKITKEWATNNNVILSNLGFGVAIQPTLVIRGDTLTAYMRNVSRGHKNAWASHSGDGGATWSELAITSIPNENNSLIYINSDCPAHEYIIYSSDRTRSDMRLLNVLKKKSINLGRELVNGYCRASFSYPNYAWDNENLHIVHSNCGMIAHHVLSKKYLERVFGV